MQDSWNTWPQGRLDTEGLEEDDESRESKQMLQAGLGPMVLI